ncbi:MAG: DUF2254 domain-containing protein [Rhodospirillales bacterium]
MKARLRKLFYDLKDSFWLVPAAMVLAGILGALGLVAVDRAGIISDEVLNGSWLYNGGGAGARTLLGAVAATTIGVAGTVFSITIAALSLAAAQMGPRLLRNFTRDRGNQVTLGAFLGTFSYALMVLRSVRTVEEGQFVPHASLTFAIMLAIVCVGTLVYFVGHMATRINVDTVIELVGGDMRAAMQRLTSEEPQASPPPDQFWRNGQNVTDSRRGYLQQLDFGGLADWAAAHDTAIRLLVRPGDYIFPGAPIAVIVRPVDGAAEAIRKASALGSHRASSADLESAVRQLVEVAVRALSPGINDPHTAIGVLDRLGSALCDLAPVYLLSGVVLRAERPALVVPVVQYDALTDSMFHMIRQNARANPHVLIRLLDVLIAVLSCEQDQARIETLQRHAELVMGDAKRNVATPDDLDDVARHYESFMTMRRHGVLGVIGALDS